MKFDSPSNQAWGIVKDDFIRWDRRVNSSNFSLTPSIISSLSVSQKRFTFRRIEAFSPFFSKSFESNNRVCPRFARNIFLPAVASTRFSLHGL